MCCVVTSVLAALLALTVLPTFGRVEVFLETPLDDYSNRTTLRDCKERFYQSPTAAAYSAYGNVRAPRGEFLHMVAIGWTRSTNEIDYLCGGSLITNVFVLTAAHCAGDKDNLAPDTVRIGDTNLGSPEDDEYAQQIAIASFTTHPRYKGFRSYFDIAIIRLKSAANFASGACNACLWREEDVPQERMTAIGFGATGFFEKASPTLLRVELDSIDASECAKRLTVARRKVPDGIQIHQFCAAGNGMDTCEGDSGGPLGVKRIDINGYEVPLVAGVVSFGTPCINGSTGVYTKVSAFMDWIEKITNTSFDYIECQKLSSSCGGRNRMRPINILESLTNNRRYGLLWDNVPIKSLYECGATLIDYQYFLTAAACVTSAKGYPKYVAYAKEELARITDVYVAPKYRPGSPENNIALIKIDKFVNTRNFRPPCLWNKNIDGEWDGSRHFSAYLPYTESKDDPWPISKTFFTNLYIPGLFVEGCDAALANTSDVVCYTSRIKMMPGVCRLHHGASVPNELSGIIHLHGIVSTMSKGCDSTIFVTDVTPHIDWIEAIIIHQRDKFLIFSN